MGIIFTTLGLLVVVFFSTSIIQFVFSAFGYIFQVLLFLILVATLITAIYSKVKNISTRKIYDEIKVCIKREFEKLKRNDKHKCYHTVEDCENCIDASKCEQVDKEYEFMQDDMK